MECNPYPLGLIPSSDSYATCATGIARVGELSAEAGPSECKQPDGPRAKSGARLWSRINDA